MPQRASTNRDAGVIGKIALEEDRVRAAPLLARLRSGERQWEDLSASEWRLLSGGPIIDYLLEKSYALRFENPERMVALARAASVAADGLEARRYGRQIAADLRVRAWAELANAYRVAEDFEAAGAAFGRVQKLVGEGTRSPSLLARVSEVMASYFTDLRRFADAVPLLEEAHELFRLAHDAAGRERSLLKLAHVLTQANEPERAAIAYLRALHWMRPEASNHLPLVHSLALNLVECGLPDLADSLLNRYGRLYRRAGRLNKYRRYWLEGKIATGLQDFGKAEGKLNTARLAFLRVGKPGDSALVSLDLAWVYAKQGRRQELVWLVDEMLRTFRSLGIARESFASLLLLKKSCEEKRSAEELCGQIGVLAKLLPELAPQTRGSTGKAPTFSAY